MTSDKNLFWYRPTIKEALKWVPQGERKIQLEELVKFSKMQVGELLELSDSKSISALLLNDLGVDYEESIPDDDSVVEIEEYMKIIAEKFNRRLNNIQLSSVKYVVGKGAIECVSNNENWEGASERIQDFNQEKYKKIEEGVHFLWNWEVCFSWDDCIQVKFMVPWGSSEYIIMDFTSNSNDDILYKHDLLVLKNLLIGKNISKLIEERLSKMKEKYSDGMTWLYNSTYFNEMLNKPGHDYSGVFIDISFFKKINDKNGQDFWDEAIKEVARFLEESVRPNDRVVRIGWDEFFILFHNGEKSGDTLTQNLELFVERIEKKAEDLSLYNEVKGEKIELKLVFWSAVSSSKDPQNAKTLLRIANDAAVKDPAWAAYRVLSVFKDLKVESTSLAIKELLTNKRFNDTFFPALIASGRPYGVFPETRTHDNM